MLAVPVFNQVRLLVASLGRKTLKAIDFELKDLVNLYGDDTRLYYLKCLLDKIDFNDQKTNKDQLVIQLVNQEISDLIVTKPNFVSLLCRALDTSRFSSEASLGHFIKVLMLPAISQIAVGLALIHVEDRKIAGEAGKFLLSKLEVVTSETHLTRPPDHLMHKLALFLQSQESLSEKTRDLYLRSFLPEYQNKLHFRPFTSSASADKSTSTATGQTIDGKATQSASSQVSIAMIMCDLGPSCLATKEAFKKVIGQFQRILPEDLAQAIGMMAQIRGSNTEKSTRDLVSILKMEVAKDKKGGEESPSTYNWNISVFVETIHEIMPRHIWPDVYQKFDYSDFFIPDKKGFQLLVDTYKAAAPSSTFPLDPFLREWKNKIGQLSFIRHAIAKANGPGFFSTSNRVLSPIEGGLSENESKAKSSWCSLDLIDSLLKLGSNEDTNSSVWEILRLGLRTDPEMLLFGLIHLRHQLDTPVGKELLGMLVPQVYWDFPATKELIQRIWMDKTKREEFLMDSLAMETTLNRGFTHKALEIILSLEGGLDKFLQYNKELVFTVELAVAAADLAGASAKKAFGGGLEIWLKSQIQKLQQPFVTACMKFLHRAKEAAAIPSPEVSSALFGVLFESTALMSPQSAEELQILYVSLGPTAAAAAAVAGGGGKQGDAAAAAAVTSVDIEKEAHLYFKQIYEGKISLEEVVETLTNFKNSKDSRENEMFMCMIHALFDEYRFFNQYPEKELRITAVLFGLLIKHRLVYLETLGIALRYVLDALQKKPNTNVFQFGMWALEQFKERLHQWPQYCALLVEIQDLRQSYPKLVSYIEMAASEANKQQQLALAQAGGGYDNGGNGGDFTGGYSPGTGNPDGTPRLGDNSVENNNKRIGDSKNGGASGDSKKAISVSAAITIPPEGVRDKIHFLINNLSKANVDDKVLEIKKFIEPNFFPYFSSFLVTKRVAQEANHLEMYASFLKKLGDRILYKVITNDTYIQIRVLMASEKIVQSFDERKKLKNLGSWLGLMTLARNRPILAKQMRLKELVLEAYSNGKLIVVVPFVANVLEMSIHSKRIFKLPNPWMMAMLSLLKEVMEVDDLKLNLKFAIECLFNKLKIEVENVTTRDVLVNRPSHAGNLKPKENNDPVNANQQSPQQGVVNDPIGTGANSDAAQQRLIGQHGAGDEVKVEDAKDPTPYVKIHPSIALFERYPELKDLVPLAVEKAIQDILNVVMRSVQIACVTTRSLIMKDFAMEPDHTKIQRAAHQMVRKLTSSLALVTCKDPLRSNISSNLASKIEERANSPHHPRIVVDQAMLEQACMQISADNLELGCTLVENYAADRAKQDIDEILAAFYLRKQQGPAFPSSFPKSLPAELKPAPNGELSFAQARVYDDFGSSRVHPDITKAAENAELKEAEHFPAGALPGNATGGNNNGRRSRSAIGSQQPQVAPASGLGNIADRIMDPAQQQSSSSSQVQAGQQQLLTNEAVLENLVGAYAALKKAIFAFPDGEIPLASLKSPKAQNIHKIMMSFPQMLRAAPREENSIFPKEVMFLTFADKVFKDLFAERTNALTISSQCAVLKYVVAAFPAAMDRMSEWLLLENEPELAERKYRKAVVTALIGNHLVDTAYIDEYLRKLLISNLNHMSANHGGEPHPARWRELQRTIDLCITLVRDLVVKETILPPKGLRNIIEVLLRLPASVSRPFEQRIKMLFDGLHSLRPEQTAATATNTAQSSGVRPGGAEDLKHDKSGSREGGSAGGGSFKVAELPVPVEDQETQEMRQRSTIVLDEWLTICLQGTVSDKTYAQYLQILRNEGLLATTKSTNLFFRIITELCINHSSKSQTMNYTTIDALAKLVVFLVKFLDNTNKIALLSAFLQVAAHVLIRDHDAKKGMKIGFNQKSYLRLFTNLLYDLNTPDPSLDSSLIEVLNAFTHTFHKLRPSRVPAFAFAWVELIAHRMFMPKLLISKPHRCSVMFKTLIVDLLEFLKPYLQNAELTEQVHLLYKGTLRILLVLLHGFPEFLCEFHFSFCDAIPTTCIQMRNLILSAFPRNVRLPDPLTPNLKVDLLPEITHPPSIGCDVTEALINHNVLAPLEQYVSTRQPSSFPQKLCEKLQTSAAADSKAAAAAEGSSSPSDAAAAGEYSSSSSKYDVRLVNSLVLHVGMQGIAKLQAKNEEGMDNACMDIFERLVMKLDPEGRYYVLNAIANQLRYPNNHTHYFSCVLLYLFLHSEEMFVKEQITRVLLERLIVHQPHPWGLLITFIELIKNPQYEFSRQPFTNCAPEIARLFDSVTRSCMPAKEDGSGAAGGGARGGVHLPSAYAAMEEKKLGGGRP